MKKLLLLFTLIFTFSIAKSQCHYVVDMQDSYGDGWNGASIAVNVNGTVLANWGLSSGAAGSDSLETLNGDVVDFIFTGGSWDSEITFQITDPAGNNIYNGGAPAAGSFLVDTSNATCVPATVNVTFQVDMNQVTAGFTTPEVNGTWNNWCGNCNPMTDADGDGINDFATDRINPPGADASHGKDFARIHTYGVRLFSVARFSPLIKSLSRNKTSCPTHCVTKGRLLENCF